MNMPKPISPVSFTGETASGVKLEGSGFTITGVNDRTNKEPVNFTVGRLHVTPQRKSSGVLEDGPARTKDGILSEERLDKLVTVVLWKDTDIILGHAVIDEDHFIQGLRHLFPNEELTHHPLDIIAALNKLGR